MKMTKIFAALAAAAVSASSFAAMTFSSASAAVTEIPYTQSEGSLSTDNDGRSVRRNIFNIWTTPQTTDIAQETEIINNVTVNFTVEGLNDGDVANAWIAGSIAGASVWTLADAGDNAIELNGNGDYSVSWLVPSDSSTIDCLILQTDINYFSYGDFETLEGSGINLTINSITTGIDDAPVDEETDAPADEETDAPTDEETDAPADEETDAPAEEETDAPADEESSANDEESSEDESSKDESSKDESSEDESSKKDESSKDESSKKEDSNKDSNGGKNEQSAGTGVAGVGMAVAGIALAATAAVVSRKRK